MRYKIIILLMLLITLWADTAPSHPEFPELKAVYEHEYVKLIWNKKAESSKDPLTGYSDFEGYRIYRSSDGGINWGSSWNKIYDYSGNHVGWKPYAQFDFDLKSDSLHCIYSDEYYNSSEGEYCYSLGYDPNGFLGYKPGTNDSNLVEDACQKNCPDDSLVYYSKYIRTKNIKGYDPLANWFIIGDDGGLENTFIDSSVLDGVAYTYAVTAYDMGMSTFSVEFTDEDTLCLTFPCKPDSIEYIYDGIFKSDTSWTVTNPDRFTGLNYQGYPSFESPKLYESFTDYNANGICDNEPFIDADLSDINQNGICDNDADWTKRNNPINVFTITPGYKASNITFPEDNFIISDSLNIGNGARFYEIVNEYELKEGFLRFEINADLNLDAFGDKDGSYATLNPGLYIYEVFGMNNSNPVDQYEIYVADISADSIEVLLELPGTNYDEENNRIFVPNYKLEDFKLTYVNDPLSSSHWTDWFDGIQFRFDNGPNDFTSDIQLVELKSVTYNDKYDQLDTLLEDIMDIKMRYKDLKDLKNRLMYRYKVEFSSSFIDTAISSGSNCDMLPGGIKTLLPFKITNISTGKEVFVDHKDKGNQYGQVWFGELTPGGCTSACVEPNMCISGSCDELVGYKNCNWELNEFVIIQDTVYSSSFASDNRDNDEDGEIDEDDLEGSSEKIFELKVGFDQFAYFQQYLPENFFFNFWNYVWNDEANYNSGSMVIHWNGMLYLATEDVSITNQPHEWFDNNGDNVSDNPWKILYPWDEGDYVILEPYGWYIDGDAWTADLSSLGASDGDSSDDLQLIKVVPNPYIANSDYFNESPGNYKIRFTHLPTSCEITIFTISGELVSKISHNDRFDGNHWWDLKNTAGHLIAPGLYIYTVEAPGIKEPQIGKFAVVR